jgi:CSLREA domain-containing protein
MPSPLVKIFILLLLVFGVAVGSYASTLTITKVEDTNDGVCDADCSLREAVSAAASGDTVVFSSLFNSPQTITLLNGQIAIDKNLTITGTGQDLVTVSGNNSSRILLIFVNGVTVNISGMTFRDGNGGSPTIGIGGAIRVIGTSTLNISNATFTNNRTGTQSGGGGAIEGSGNSILMLSNLIVTDNFGSAIDATNSLDIRNSIVSRNVGGGVSALILNVERCIISANTGPSAFGVGAEHLTVVDSTITNNTDGGVTDGDAASTMIIDRCLISGNSRYPTGGGVKSVGTTVIKNSKIMNNAASDYGGGIVNLGTLYMINSVASGNQSWGDGGGGVATPQGNLFVINSTISGNIASGSGSGGGIYVLSGIFASHVTVINSTITNNQSSSGGGGIRVDNGQTATMQNSIIGGNTSTQNDIDVSGIFASQGNNLVGNIGGSSGWIASDLLNENPVLGPLADNGGSTMTHSLLPASPAINAGSNSLAIDPQTQMPLTGDQRGFIRFYGGSVDIGAYESQPEVTGTVAYGNAPGARTPRFVASVLLNAVGSPNISATTSAIGVYTLGGFGSGSYTVTPSKTGDANGISSFDAGLVARHAAGITPLIGNQLIVADVSGNGTISSFDAGQIARYAAGLNGSGASGNWIFMPANRSYPSVTSSITGEDFIALLMGDVSGNWMEPVTSNR